ETDYLIIAEKEHQRIFLGTYEEFLEKDGWQEPSPRKVAKTPIKATAPIKKSPNNKIASLENQIEYLEKNLNDIEALLALSYEKNNTQESNKLLLQAEEMKQKIDEIYLELDNLYRGA
ncbi:MAG: DUF5320 domain-containing protein, partial [Verrucomicrobia bacterium]|nr:DUF5320 domain-containing protein [Verrucomicrobiota bacterium]